MKQWSSSFFENVPGTDAIPELLLTDYQLQLAPLDKWEKAQSELEKELSL